MGSLKLSDNQAKLSSGYTVPVAGADRYRLGSILLV